MFRGEFRDYASVFSSSFDSRTYGIDSAKSTNVAIKRALSYAPIHIIRDARERIRAKRFLRSFIIRRFARNNSPNTAPSTTHTNTLRHLLSNIFRLLVTHIDFRIVVVSSIAKSVWIEIVRFIGQQQLQRDGESKQWHLRYDKYLKKFERDRIILLRGDNTNEWQHLFELNRSFVETFRHLCSEDSSVVVGTKSYNRFHTNNSGRCYSCRWFNNVSHAPYRITASNREPSYRSLNATAQVVTIATKPANTARYEVARSETKNP